MQKEERKQQDSTLFEGMTSIRALIDGIRQKGNTRRILKVLIDPEKNDKNYKNIGYLKANDARNLARRDRGFDNGAFSSPPFGRIRAFGKRILCHDSGD